VSKQRRREEEGHEDEERWLITYADMITLLMAFFIMMYSMSVVDLKKFEALSDATRHVFGGKVVGPTAKASASAGLLDGGSSLMHGAGSLAGNHASLVNDIRGELDRRLSDGLRKNVVVTHAAGLVTISMKADTVVFPVGEARLTTEVRQILDAIGPPLRDSVAPMLVEGHTCDIPINTARFPSNWELSAMRAANVMVYLIRNHGIDPDHVSAVGYADTRPIVPNDSEANRTRNRRVDIVVLTEDVARDASRVGETERAHANRSLRLRPVSLRPPIDLRARYYDHTGRRGADTPATHSRREVH